MKWKGRLMSTNLEDRRGKSAFTASGRLAYQNQAKKGGKAALRKLMRKKTNGR